MPEINVCQLGQTLNNAVVTVLEVEPETKRAAILRPPLFGN